MCSAASGMVLLYCPMGIIRRALIEKANWKPFASQGGHWWRWWWQGETRPQRAQAENPEPEHARGGLADVRVAPCLVKFQRASCPLTSICNITPTHASLVAHQCLFLPFLIIGSAPLLARRGYSQMCVCSGPHSNRAIFRKIEWNAERPLATNL